MTGGDCAEWCADSGGVAKVTVGAVAVVVSAILVVGL